ncbi:MAG: fasciclin domain-containing protein [Phycisphaeraceae bacterium]|nr:fasciclin domain-containing protein [Phycisphaerales bacterium]MCB9858938.1 fasciclin domain-containing protein [Phycisphaeraceae bacterium]
MTRMYTTAFAILACSGAALAQCSSTTTASSCSEYTNEHNATITLASHELGDNIVQTAQKAGSFNTLLAAAKAAGLVDALSGKGPLTVFAPTDEAFAKLPKGTVESLLMPENKEMLKSVLLFHVVKGDVSSRNVTLGSGATSLNGQRIDFATNDKGAWVNGAMVTAADIECTNGTIHVIDTVILPEQRNIVEVANSAGSFNTLLTAATHAGLAGALSGEGPFTILAPTDEAFAKLPAGTVESLLKPENKQKLAEILKYHVIPAKAYSTDAIGMGAGKSLQGNSVMFTVRDGQLFADNARIIKTDIDASNGVIHVIDRVILPE